LIDAFLAKKYIDKCQGSRFDPIFLRIRLSFSSKTRIKKLYLQDLSSDEMLEILMDDILSGKI
jgi:hypothetical protein